MISHQQLSQLATLYEPASDGDIVLAQQSLDLIFPQEYIDLLKISNGLEIEDVVSLYANYELEERNTIYQVKKYAYGWLLVGDDGGGRGILLDCTEKPGVVYMVDLGSMQPSDAEVLASNLEEWINNGFKID